MKFEIGETVQNTNKKSTEEEYIIYCKPNNPWLHNDVKKYYCIVGKAGIDLQSRISIKKKDFDSDDVPSLVDNFGVARFHSLEDIQNWLNGESVFVTVGSRNYRIEIPGINQCRAFFLHEIDMDSIYVEKRVIMKQSYMFPLKNKKEEKPGQARTVDNKEELEKLLAPEEPTLEPAAPTIKK